MSWSEDLANPGAWKMRRSAREAASVARRVAPVQLVGYLLVMVVTALAPVVTAWLMKLIIDRLVGLIGGAGAEQAGAVAGLVGLAVGLAAVGVLSAVLPQVTGYLGSEVGRRFAVGATDHMFAAVTRLPGLRPFEDPRFLDRMRLAQEATSTGGTTVTGGFALGQAVVTVAGFLGSLLVISPAMTVIVLLSAVPALWAQLLLSRWRAGMLLRLSPTERWQVFYSQLLGQVDAAKEIRLFGSGGFLHERLMRHLRTATAARRRMDRRELGVEGALALLGAVVAGGGLVWAITAAVSGRLSPGDITMFISAVAGVQGALTSLVGSVGGVHQGLLLFGHYLAVTEAPPDLPIAGRPVPVPPLRQGIDLKDVWFRYTDQHPWVLKGVTLTIPAGKAIGLVGLNGAGKSTLVKLLCRFYDPDRGVIRWDGVDIRRMRPEELRARISGVFQDHTSYDLSAEDNIVLGDASSYGDLGRVRAAANLAGLDGTLSALPNGYQTLLTRMFFSQEDKQDPATGVVLSGGQWQRLALARAYFREGRDLMILDEPSAGLDPQAEAELHTQMRRYRQGTTSLLISHRLNTIRDADQLFVLDSGTLAEQGTHQDLMRADGSYAKLFRMQGAGYQPDLPQEHSASRVP